MEPLDVFSDLTVAEKDLVSDIMRMTVKYIGLYGEPVYGKPYGTLVEALSAYVKEAKVKEPA